MERFFSTIASLRPAFKFDPLTGQPVFDIGICDIKQPLTSLDEIFTYLESADKRCIVAIAEFQQIANYPEKNVEAILRTHIQKSKNTNFVFAGSQRHIIQNIFFSASKPFYQSTTLLNLEPIRYELLFAIGKEGKVNEITSAAFINKHGLYSPSSVQSAIRQLLEKELVTKEGNTYHIYDRFFGLWIANTYGTGYGL